MERSWVPTKSRRACLLASSLTIGFATASSAADLLLDQAEFLSAAGAVTVESFESAPLSGTADSGALPSIPFADFAVASVPTAVKVLGAPYYGHHNTTPGGSRYLSIDTDVAGASGYVTLTFDEPIYSIGFFLIGSEKISLVETRPVEILLDGVEYPIPTTPYDGNRYVGLLSSTPFTTLEIHADPVDSFWSLDDIAYSTQVSASAGTDVFFDRAPFLAATEWLSTEDFEAAPLSGTVDGGALAQIAFDDFTASSVPNAVKVFDAPYGGNHNTTPGGSHYLAFDTDVGSLGASASLVFGEPINDVGFFLINADHITAVDPMPVTVAVAGREYPIPPPGTSGEVFFGVVRESGFSQVAVYPDPVDSFWSLDDVSYVPEPSARAMAGIGVGALLSFASIRGRGASRRRVARSPASSTGSTARWTTLAASLLPLTLAGPALASDGVLEINETCAVNTGCFAGDEAGFPVTINGSAGRSYRLTGDLTVSDVNTDGIVVWASGVSIDLNGFEIGGPVTCSAGTSLICTPASGTGIGVKTGGGGVLGTSVKNGSIRGMGASGVQIFENTEITNLRVYWNSIYGIYPGSGSTVSGNTVFQNGREGILANEGSTISGNTVYENGRDGISAEYGSTVSRNTVYANWRDGIKVSTAGAAVQGNTVRANRGFGLNLTGATYRENTITSNLLGPVTGTAPVNTGNNYCAGTGTGSADCP